MDRLQEERKLFHEWGVEAVVAPEDAPDDIDDPIAYLENYIRPIVIQEVMPGPQELSKLRRSIIRLAGWIAQSKFSVTLEPIPHTQWPSWVRGESGLWDVICDLNNAIADSQREEPLPV